MLFDFDKIPQFISHISYADSMINLNTRVSVLGREYRDQTSYDWHGLRRGRQEFVLWQYTISGRGKLIYEGCEYDLLPNEAMLVHIPHDHRYFFPKDAEHWDFIFMILRGVEALRIGREAEKINGPVIKYRDSTQSLQYAAEIFKKVRENSSNSYQLSGLATQFCLGLLTDITPDKRTTSPPAINRAVKYALAHFEEPIGIDELAEEAELSRFHFSREFKKNLGSPPADFIRKLRLDKAINLLQSSSMPIYIIAEQCGFASSSYFCRAFAKEFGISPNAFRDNEVKNEL